MKLSRLIELAGYADDFVCFGNVTQAEADEVHAMLQNSSGPLLVEPPQKGPHKLGRWMVNGEFEIKLP
jgi:hypothetical protein